MEDFLLLLEYFLFRYLFLIEYTRVFYHPW